MQLLARMVMPLIVLVAVLVMAGALAAGSLVAFRVVSSDRSSLPPQAAAQKVTGQHPCNHGFYVSQAAHAHKGGAYVSAIAQSDLGKDGSCSAPLPAQAPAPKPKSSTDD